MPSMTDDKYVQIKRTMCFADLYNSTIFSCPFSSAAIAEGGENDAEAGSTV